MKIMVIADIHGSLTAINKVMEIFKEEKADKLLILGDILYHGPRNDLPEGHDPKGVIEVLNSMKNKILCVRGNCDAEVDQCVLEFPIMASYMLMDVGEKQIFATHGDKMDSLKDVALTCDVVLSGHTHVPKLEKEDNTLFVNPGSISLPKEESEPSYALIESSKLLLRSVNKVTVKSLDGKVLKSSSF